MDLSTANNLWRVRQEVRIQLYTLSHPQLLEFSRSCQRLFAEIEIAYKDDFFWRKYIGALRRIRFDLAANPIPFDAASAGASRIVRSFRDGLRRRKRVYPDIAEDAIALVNAAELLVTSKDGPLLEYLYFEELLEGSDNERVGLVVRESRYLPSLSDELVALDASAVRALTPMQLKGSEEFDRLIFIGPTAWFPDHVIASPRRQISGLRTLTGWDLIVLPVLFVQVSARELGKHRGSRNHALWRERGQAVQASRCSIYCPKLIGTSSWVN